MDWRTIETQMVDLARKSGGVIITKFDCCYLQSVDSEINLSLFAQRLAAILPTEGEQGGSRAEVGCDLRET